MRWQIEAQEQKQREEDEINRGIMAVAKARLISVIMNPDDYLGCDLPNVPYGEYVTIYTLQFTIENEMAYSTLFL